MERHTGAFTATKPRARRVVRALAVAGLSAGLVLGGAAGSQAQAPAQPNVPVSCSASGTTYFSPGVQVLPMPQHISYQGQEGQCADSSGLGIREAKITANFENVIVSCVAGGMRTGNGSGTIEWTLDDGTKLTSQVDLSIDRTALNTASVSGHVTQGRFQGQGFSGEFTTDLFGGAGKCTIGAPMGGVKDAAFNGRYSIN